MNFSVIRTANVNLHFAEICWIVRRKLKDDISVFLQATSTLQIDCCPVRHSARVLATHGVVPQSRSRDGGGDVRQTNDEVVRSETYANDHEIRLDKLIEHKNVLSTLDVVITHPSMCLLAKYQHNADNNAIDIIRIR